MEAIRRPTGRKYSQVDLANKSGARFGTVQKSLQGGRVLPETAEKIEAGLERLEAEARGEMPEGICPCPMVLAALPIPLQRHVEIAIRSVRILAEKASANSAFAATKLQALAEELQRAAGHAERLTQMPTNERLEQLGSKHRKR